MTQLKKICGFLVPQSPIYSFLVDFFYKLKRMLMETYAKDERTKKGFKKKVWPSTPD